MSINKQNLKLIRDYLASGAVKNEFFDMGTYWSCGTIGCVIGHAAHSGIPELEVLGTEYNVVGCICYGDYSERVTGVSYMKSVWNFLFGFSWTDDSDTNTISHAVKRLDFILAQDEDYEPESLDSIISAFNCHKEGGLI